MIGVKNSPGRASCKKQHQDVNKIEEERHLQSDDLTEKG